MSDTLDKLLDLARECGAETGTEWVKFHSFAAITTFAERIRADQRESMAAKWEGSHGFDKYGVAAAIRSSGEQGESTC